MSERILGAVLDELQAIRARFDTADRRLLAAGAAGNLEAVEAERREAAGDHHEAATALAHLELVLLRYAVDYEPAAVQAHLTDIIRQVMEPEIRRLAAAIVKLEAR